MCNMCFLPSTGISARIFAKWLEMPTLNEINDLIETGFVQTTTRRTISLHPMIQEITLSETKPSVSSCHILLDSLQKICLMHGIEVDYYKKLFQTAGNIIELIEKMIYQNIYFFWKMFFHIWIIIITRRYERNHSGIKKFFEA